MTKQSLRTSLRHRVLQLGLLAAIASSLMACSTATIINATIDLASFVPQPARAATVPLPALPTPQSLTPLNDGDGNQNNGFLIETPISGIDIIEGFNTSVSLAVGSSNATSLKAELFIAPVSAVDAYLPQYSVASSSDKTIAAGGKETVKLDFDLQPSNSNQALNGALVEIKKGQFRLGLKLSLSAPTGGNFSFSLDKAVAGVTGYPAKIIAR
jgi:hypothetical protein